MNDLPIGRVKQADPAWLDEVLRCSLPPPQLPDGFRTRLVAAARRSGEHAMLPTQQDIAAEYERQVADLHRRYVRLQWRTLGTLLGVAFVCGTGLSLAMPWIRQQLDNLESPVWAAGGVLAGVALGVGSWLRPGSWWRASRWPPGV